MLLINGSLTVNVPAEIARALNIRKGSKVNVALQGDSIMVTPVPDPAEGAVLRTIGYEGHSLDSFVALLKNSGVKQLLDVRDLPLSRKRGFSKTPLRGALADAGILYEHVRDLGAPDDVRKPFLEGGGFGEFKRKYLAHLQRHRAALNGVKWHLTQAPTAIMCVERVHSACHRGILAEQLALDGVKVVHL